MFFVNQTGIIGTILESGTQTLTGDIVATLFIIFFFLVAIAIMFRIPLEFLAILIIPFCLSLAAYYSTFMIPLIIILIYLAMIAAKNWLFK